MYTIQSFVFPVCSFELDSNNAANIKRVFGTAFLLGVNGYFMTAKHVLRNAFAEELPKGQFIGLCTKNREDLKSSEASQILNWESAPKPHDVAVGLIVPQKNVINPIQEYKTTPKIFQDVFTFGYPQSISYNKNNYWGIGLRSNKGYIQRIIGDGTLPNEEPPLRYESDFLIGLGMSGSPLLIDDYKLIGICTGSSRSEIIEDQYEEIINSKVTFKETRLKIEQHGISESIQPLLDWRAIIFENRTLSEILMPQAEKI